MKHLISLSFKYIRRQKLRTFLTFMCIMLSAFILATVCVYGSSIYTTLYNYTVDEDGLWELEISAWIYDKEDLDIAKHHAVVADYCYGSGGHAFFTYERPEGEPYWLGMFEISDGKNTYRVHGVSAEKQEGNNALLNIHERNSFYDFNMEGDGVAVSSFIRDMGYNVGDTVTLRISPFTAVYDEDSDVIKEIRADLKERNGTELLATDEGFDELPKDIKKKARQTSIRRELENRGYTMQDFPLADKQYHEAKEITFRIAAFITEKDFYNSFISFILINSENSDITINDLVQEDELIRVNNDSSDLHIRLIDNYDYDDAVKMLFTDLGHDYSTEFYDTYKYGYASNDLLLALEVKSPYAMYKMLASVIVPALIVLLIAWFISRFVIDNTFEMAVKERSTHFAALRIIGASKTQVAALVFIEAVFYCFTAVPLGIISAILLCKGSFTTLRHGGLEMFEFSAKPLFIITAAFLTVLAIFISAYTSAMWAARKLSPAEALNFGKPGRKKRKLRRRKSKLNLSSKKFIRRYTKKNIMTAKSRFIVSTITMALGVLMFTLTTLIMSFFYGEYKKETAYYKIRDFYIDDYYSYASGDPTEEIARYFGDKELFSECIIEGTSYFDFNKSDGSAETAIEKLSADKDNSAATGFLHIINEDGYNDLELDTITGMSYKEFAAKKGALYNNCIYGDEREYDENGKPLEMRERSYSELENALKLTTTNGESFNIIGVTNSTGINESVILPIELAEDYDTSFSIELLVNGRKNYDKALVHFNDFKNNETYVSAENRYMTGTGMSTFISAIVKIILIFLVSIWLVGILSMINSVNTSVLNRSRELMMLRSVGMTRQQLRRSIILETLMFSVTAAIAGTFIGVAGFMLFINTAGLQKLMVMAYVIPVILVSLGVNIIIALLAALPAIRSLGKVETIAQASSE